MTPPLFPTAELQLIRSELARSKPHITTMNFIVWIDREANREWVIQRAIKISEKHPSRTIILDASPGRVGAHVRPLDPDNSNDHSTFIDIGVAEGAFAFLCYAWEPTRTMSRSCGGKQQARRQWLGPRRRH